MKTKEEIQSQINVIHLLHDKYIITIRDCKNNLFDLDKYLTDLYTQLESRDIKSIQDLQREAFEASRDSSYNTNIHQSRVFEDDYIYKYETFEDYLKSIE
jgi:hypothetical protein